MPDLRVSRKVLEAVRTTGQAVVGSSRGSMEGNLARTVVDQDRPRAVFCSPIAELDEALDVPYADAPAEAVGDDMLDFVRAAARVFAQGC